MKITLDGGEAIISDVITRKTKRERNLAFVSESQIVEQEVEENGKKVKKKMTVPSEKAYSEAQDLTVINMLISLKYNDKEYSKAEITQEVIDGMGDDDFKKIYEVIRKMIMDKEDTKKKS